MPSISRRIAAGPEIVWRQLTDLQAGDHTVQGVLAAWYQEGRHRLGLYGAWRQQEQEAEAAKLCAAHDLAHRFAFPLDNLGCCCHAISRAVEGIADAR